MSEISDMIQRLCPDGVEYRKFGEVCFYEQPTKFIVHSINYSDDYEIPVLTAGQSFILGYTNEVDGIYNASNDNPVIIFDDFTGAFKWVNFPFKVKSSAMKMLTSNSEVLLRYVFHYMGVLNYSSSEHTRLWIGTYSNFEIPVPPIEVQRKIVEVLDNFSELTAELTAELEARKKQYEYYRDNLLNFNRGGQVASDVKWMKMSELGTFTRGRRFVRADIVEQGYPCIHYGDMYTYYGLSATETKTYIPFEVAKKLRFAQKNDVVIVGAGENDEDIGIGVAWLGDSSPAVHDACYIFHHNQNPKFISHYLRTSFYHKQIKTSVSSGKICSISAEGIGKALIPIPPLHEQERIVSILDRFEALTTDLTAGLPAEIKARQQQYEYYRDQLLTFKRAN